MVITMLSSTTIKTIQSTVPLLQSHGETITQRFYQTMFEEVPALKNVFNMSNQITQEQPKALANSVLLFAQHIDDLEALLPAIELIAQKHCSIGVVPEQYPLVGKHLLAAIQSVLDLPDGHPALTAWAEGYGFLADALISRESEIEQTNFNKAGGWKGFRAFTISQIVAENKQTKSFYFRPIDGQEVIVFQPGQFIGIKIYNHDKSQFQIRQYSLSDNQQYRITVKRDEKGIVSRQLHAAKVGDTVEILPPNGIFDININFDQQLFIAGGVGITPLMGILKSFAANSNPQQVGFIQCARSHEELIFSQELSALHKVHDFNHKVVLEQGDEGDYSGYLDESVLKTLIAQKMFEPKAVMVYLCGPIVFMRAVNKALQAVGVPRSQIQYEVFGPDNGLD